ncbi:ATP-binding protein [Rummeliibacillus sp. G93]|uniref:AAA family ATPase n=1 Tax=Rummeliibacillus sp. G93 TaxID=2939494 RepID=UPI00201BD738|nr:ATP-binding protein [Rummeliibacillus sp. G93]UQW96687.1 ATP-binding protein [Rummeliibacillus sp. G93]
MLRKIEVSNFKSFDNFVLDLSKNNKEIKNLAAVYGENGSGKSTIVSVLHFIDLSLDTVHASKKLLELISDNENFKDIIMEKMKYDFSLNVNFSELIEKNNVLPLVSSNSNYSPTTIKIIFELNGDEGEYEIHFDQNGLVFESLIFLINKQKGTLYKIEKDFKNGMKIHLSPQLFPSNKQIENSLKNEVSSVWGQHSFLSIYKYYVSTQLNKDSIKDINYNLQRVLNFLGEINVLYKAKNSSSMSLASKKRLLARIAQGEFKNYDKPDFKVQFETELTEMEEALNQYFPMLYTDIQKVFYKIEDKNGKEAKYKLYFQKIISGKLMEVPHNLESTGTQQLLAIFPFIVAFLEGGTVIVDEIDEGIHDLLMKRIIKSIMELIEDSECEVGQLIFTTHNTTLMQDIIGPKEIYLIELDSNASKRIISLEKMEKNIQKNHNIFKLYLERQLGGTPFDMDLDLEEISLILNISGDH